MPRRPEMVKKISPVLHAELVKLAEQGQDSEQLAEWLGKTHDVWVTSRQVRRIIERHRSELADVAKSVVRETLRKHLLPAVRRVSRAAVRAEFMANAARKRAAELRKIHEQHPSAVAEDVLALKAMDRSLKASNVLLHYAGL